jgi:cation:H+ antiporter
VVIALVFGVVALVCSYPARSGFIERRRGVVLIALYILYLTVVLRSAG